MQGVYTVEEVRAAEASVLARTSEPGLMQRAASALARRCAELLASDRGVYGSRVVLLVGSGNNGGDVLFAGAALARRGARVHVLPTASSWHDAGAQALRLAGGHLLESGDAADAIDRADLVLDGILGIGGNGDLRSPAAEYVARAVTAEVAVVAADLPSGVDADTGTAGDSAVWADVTVSFGLLKAGLVLSPGSLHVGLLELVDIGLREDAVVPSVTCMEADDVTALLPWPAPTDNKYSLGVVGIAAGSSRYPGAAVLSASGAVNAKAGLVRYLGTASDDVVRALPSVIVSSGTVEDVGRVQAWGVGPGIGLDQGSLKLLSGVLSADVPTVVDADGLTLLAQRGDLLKRRPAPTVLTPHLNEFARLAPDLDVGSDPLTAVRTFAARTGTTVLLKGATTVIADPDGQARLSTTGTPWLASGGTGAVLT